MFSHATPKFHLLFNPYRLDLNFDDQDIFDYNTENIPEEKIREYRDFINWEALCDRKFSFNFLREFRNELTSYNFPREMITREFKDKLDDNYDRLYKDNIYLKDLNYE